jgi:hypothetical protein
MRIGRSIIVPFILTLGVAGSAVAGSGMSIAAAATTSAHAPVHYKVAVSQSYYHT